MQKKSLRIIEIDKIHYACTKVTIDGSERLKSLGMDKNGEEKME